MTYLSRAANQRRIARTCLAFVAGRLPFVIIFGCLLTLNWGAAIWLLNYTHHEREAAAFQLVNDELKYSEQKITGLFTEADRILLETRAQYMGEGTRLDPAGWPAADHPGGIALISPDGHVLASTPHASIAGWPRLMARLANSSDDMAIGEPVLGKGGHLGFIPVARRIIEPGGAFGGIILLSLESEAFPVLSPAIRAVDGCMSLIGDDGVILMRAPDVRGTVGIRITRSDDWPRSHRSETVTGHQVSPIDGIERIYSFHHLAGIPAALMVGTGYEATFAEWQSLRLIVMGTRLAGSGLIILGGYFWYTRRSRARISDHALTAILTNIELGVRVENGEGSTVAANAFGATLRPPADESTSSESRNPDGAVVQVSRHRLADGGNVLIGRDVTARREADARIAFLSTHDQLTGLPNRWLAATRIQNLIARKSGSGGMAALILFDLDGFKDINDTLGPDGGDQVLIEVASRLRHLVSGQDVLACLGGDEFLLFLDDPDDEAAIMSLARRISRGLARPIGVRGQQVRLGASMGIAIYPRDGDEEATLVRHADIALGRAKLAGRGTAQSFDQEMMVSFEEHRMMESDLRRALDGDELRLVLQPQFACETLEVTGFEALTRWRHPTRGELSPAVFIPIAERSGLINPLGLWAIETACAAAAAWSTRYRVAVNLSPSQLRCETIQDDIRAILRRTQFPAHLLELEVTESVLLDEDQRTLETLHKLRAMDIRITLDDFGAGYSSLSYLRRFPFDKIKIDKSFVQSGGTDRATRVILEAMIRMCTDLGFDVVAEGVETEYQLSDLRRLGCREIQGFLLSEPLRPGKVEDFLVEHGRRAAIGHLIEPARS